MTTAAQPEAAQGGLLLSGLDGSNPLAFLAALGVFRVLTLKASSTASLVWEPSGTIWVPRVTSPTLGVDEVLDLLRGFLVREVTEHPVSLLSLVKADDHAQRRQVFSDCLASASIRGRGEVDWVAAIASDMASPDANSQLQTTRRDYHLKNLTSIVARATGDHLRRALFSRWDYADSLDNQSLHLDPGEDRRHAHQWNQPAGDPDRKKSGGMLGANCLAIEALPLFVSVPEGGSLHTVGFTGSRSHNTRWTWPIWTRPISLPTLQSLLLLSELQQERFSETARTQLRQRGIAAVFRSFRILVGKTPNLTPARCIA